MFTLEVCLRTPFKGFSTGLVPLTHSSLFCGCVIIQITASTHVLHSYVFFPATSHKRYAFAFLDVFSRCEFEPD